MENLILAFPNRLDSTYYPVTFHGPAWSADLPLTNLRVPELSRVAESIDATLANTKFEVRLGIVRPIRVFVIPRHNMTRAARYRIRGSHTPGDFSSPIYDTGWLDVWTQIYEWGSINWEHPSFWDHKLSAEEAEDYDIALIHVADSEQIAENWQWEFDDPDNPDGKLRLARGVMAPGWQPPNNMRYGVQVGISTDTTRERGPGGVDYYDRKKPRRWAAFSIDLLDRNVALSTKFEMDRQLGIDRQVFFVFDPSDTANLHRLSWLATMRSPTPIEMPYLDLADTTYILDEVL